MRTVELHPAYFWICEDCAQENYCRAVRVEPEQVEHLVNEEDREAFVEQGEWTMCPETVSCSACGEEFRSSEVLGPR